jgi:excisionase family DNA binding protein
MARVQLIKVPVPPETTTAHLTIAELAKREGVSVGTVYAWNRDGTGPTPMRRGSWVRYRIEDIEEWERSLLARQPA